MSWIEETPPADASGPLGDAYRRISPSGRVANILTVQSLHPAGLREHHALYRTLMFGAFRPLTRSEREAIAVEVSRTNECHY
jgi:alkylhydroperoxidase family enzyme